ncbi:hypothetical protein VTG60DRAFT_7335 [Thermothelomyces hinnuleus]
MNTVQMEHTGDYHHTDQPMPMDLRPEDKIAAHVEVGAEHEEGEVAADIEHLVHLARLDGNEDCVFCDTEWSVVRAAPRAARAPVAPSWPTFTSTSTSGSPDDNDGGDKQRHH